jgi:hypothetical protein
MKGKCPDVVRGACQESLTRGVMRVLIATRVMQEVRSVLSEAGLPFMALKGLTLACEMYEQPGLRPIGDLDVLVPSQEADRALRVLGDLGYRPPPRSLPVRFFRRHHFHIALVREGRPSLPFELHWDTQPRFSLSRIPEADFWERARPVPIDGLTLTVPGREEVFLYLAQHLMRHVLSFGPDTREDPVGALLAPARRGRLAWIADLALLARRGPGLDWNLVERLSKRWGLDREIAGLRVYLQVHGVWPGSAPPEETAAAALDRGPGIVARVGALLPGLSRPVAAMELRPILVLRLLRFAFPGADWIRWRYHLPPGAGWGRVAWRSLSHAAGTIGRAARMAGAILAFQGGQWLSRRLTSGGGVARAATTEAKNGVPRGGG